MTVQSFNQHVDKYAFGTVPHTCALRHLRKLLPDDAAKRDACTIVAGWFDYYSNTVLYGTTSANIDKLQRLKNTLTRDVTNRRRRDHITPVLADLHCASTRSRTTINSDTAAIQCGIALVQDCADHIRCTDDATTAVLVSVRGSCVWKTEAVINVLINTTISDIASVHYSYTTIADSIADCRIQIATKRSSKMFKIENTTAASAAYAIFTINAVCSGDETGFAV